MSGLIIKLAPNERVLINGAVIENGDRRSKITIRTPNVNVLRLKDAIHPRDVTTPVAYACHLAQLVLSGDVESGAGIEKLAQQLDLLAEVFTDTESRALISRTRDMLESGNAYGAMRGLRELLPAESRILQG